MLEDLLLIVHVAATWFMVGVIWFVQVVHYPLMRLVGEAGFQRYAAAHQRRTGWVVTAAMLLELTTGAALIRFHPPQSISGLLWLGMALLAVVWGSTALWQVPRHRELLLGWRSDSLGQLVAGNWLRTAAWSLRGLLVLILAGESLKA